MKAENKSGQSSGSKPKQQRRQYSGREKCRAVLSLWGERRKAAEICQELGVTWFRLNQWQDRAMEGMLEALEPARQMKERGPELGAKVADLLERKVTQRGGRLSRLEERLARIQEQKQPAAAQA